MIWRQPCNMTMIVIFERLNITSIQQTDPYPFNQNELNDFNLSKEASKFLISSKRKNLLPPDTKITLYRT